MNEVKIDKIKLKIGDTEVEMTLEQAQELRAVLNKLWQAPFYYPASPYPAYVPPTPVVHWPPYPSWGQPIITCASDSTSGCLFLSAK